MVFIHIGIKWGGIYMKLYIIRHGQTDWNSKGKIQGSKDISLNRMGLAQGYHLSDIIIENNYNISKIYCSKQKRAIETAEILSNKLNVEHEPIDGIEEMNFGDWEGLTWEEIRNCFPKQYLMWYEHRRYTKVPRGESYEDVLKRSLIAINSIIEENEDDVAIISHGGVIKTLQCYLTNTPFNKMGNFKSDNSSILEVDSDDFKEVTELII